VPARIAAANRAFGRLVLMPTSVPSASTISSVIGSLRVRLSETETKARAPAVSSPSIAPGFGQCTTSTLPSGRW
jgi:hypothetical protein